MLRKNTFLIITLIWTLQLSMFSQINTSLGSNYAYLKGSLASTLPSNWMNANYATSNWATGQAPFGYGDNLVGTVLSDMQNNYSTLYLKGTFSAQNVENIRDLIISADYDDGFTLWINGEEVLSRNAPDNPISTSLAPNNHESGTLESFKLNTSAIPLIDGINTIALQGFNTSLQSSDFRLDIQLNAEPTLPKSTDSSEVSFSHPAGFYSTAFALTLTAPDNTYAIKYTIDGSNPQSSATAITSTHSTTITVNPDLTTNRAATPAFVVRASLSKDGFQPSIPAAHTFIFIDKVISQGHPGGDWPTSSINSQVMDFNMDTRVTQHATYGPQMQTALTDIPSLCVSTDIQNLFDPTTGIYVNAEERGIEWEKMSSFELLHPDGKEGFHINAGLRIRGGWSRHPDFPKHSFRLFFRADYGDSKLRYPLFEEEGVAEYDKIDLRTAQNYAWSRGQSNNTFIREVFSRDTQRDMEQPYTRSRYYHLYLNGMYWGLYQTQERSEARFAADYLGGSKDDYDVIKCDGTDYVRDIEATDGVLDTWQELYNRCSTGFETNSSYFDLEGKDKNGWPKKNSQILVDIDNLIDYMITIFYTGNFDSPSSKFSGDNNAPNNLFAIFKRDDKTKGFVFFCHDSEHSLMTEGHSPGIGLEENRVTIPGLNVSSFWRFHPQWLHQRLSANAEYRQRFADRVEKHFFDDGVFTPTAATKRFNDRANKIQWAIIAESSRWGDATGKYLKTKDNDWLPEINKVRSVFFPQRPAIVIDQLKNASLYPTISSATLKNGTETIPTEHINLSDITSLTIHNPNNSGTIYITTNGTDPRLIGGDINRVAIAKPNGSTLYFTETTILKSRIRENGIWSALKTYHFIEQDENYSNLKITELNYHPSDSIDGLDTISGKFFEFVEFKNTGSSAINLSELIIDSIVSYTFPKHTILPAYQFYVIATKPKWFYERYGMIPSGNCENFMANDGEEFILKTPTNEKIIHFFYSDSEPWPLEADGLGYSLTARDAVPTLNPNDYNYWSSSSKSGGTPFAMDWSVINPLEAVTDIAQDLSLFPNPCDGLLHIRIKENSNWAMQLEIRTITGQLIVSTPFTQNTDINLNHYHISKGMLIVKVLGRQRVETLKLMYIGR